MIRFEISLISKVKVYDYHEVSRNTMPRRKVTHVVHWFKRDASKISKNSTCLVPLYHSSLEIYKSGVLRVLFHGTVRAFQSGKEMVSFFCLFSLLI